MREHLLGLVALKGIGWICLEVMRFGKVPLGLWECRNHPVGRVRLASRDCRTGGTGEAKSQRDGSGQDKNPN